MCSLQTTNLLVLRLWLCGNMCFLLFWRTNKQLDLTNSNFSFWKLKMFIRTSISIILTNLLHTHFNSIDNFNILDVFYDNLKTICALHHKNELEYKLNYFGYVMTRFLSLSPLQRCYVRNERQFCSDIE